MTLLTSGMAYAYSHAPDLATDPSFVKLTNGNLADNVAWSQVGIYVEIVFDFTNPTGTSEARFYCPGPYSVPSYFEVNGSNDGSNYTLLAAANPDQTVGWKTVTWSAAAYRYIKVTIYTYPEPGFTSGFSELEVYSGTISSSSSSSYSYSNSSSSSSSSISSSSVSLSSSSSSSSSLSFSSSSSSSISSSSSSSSSRSTFASSSSSSSSSSSQSSYWVDRIENADAWIDRSRN